MNWYFKTILAQVAAEPSGAIEYLQRIGATPDIIQYISSLEKNNAQILINEFRKNPSLTIQQLQEIQMPQKEDPYLPTEKRMAANFELEIPEFAKWILVSFRKLRRGIFGTDNMGNKFLPHTYDSDLSDQEMNIYTTFRDKIREIADLYCNIRPDISSYSAQEAAVASDEWHRMMAGQGEGKNYEPTKKELIMYGPEWQNPEWKGWTIQKVMSENDLLTEGNIMNHCVGSYCDQVEEGHSVIYSLRDTGNKPYATIETNGYNDVVQIQGNSNSEPDSIYKAMIKEWLMSNKNPGIEKAEYAEDPFSEISARYDEPSAIGEAIEKVEGADEYGLQVESSWDGEDIAELAFDMEEKTREPSYYGGITDIPHAIIDMLVAKDKQKKSDRFMGVNNFQTYIQREEGKIWDEFYGYGWDHESYPQEDQYETEEEFEEAEEEYREAEQDYMDEEYKKHYKGGFFLDSMNYINELRGKGEIPPYIQPKEKTINSGN